MLRAGTTAGNLKQGFNDEFGYLADSTYYEKCNAAKNLLRYAYLLDGHLPDTNPLMLALTPPGAVISGSKDSKNKCTADSIQNLITLGVEDGIRLVEAAINQLYASMEVLCMHGWKRRKREKGSCKKLTGSFSCSARGKGCRPATVMKETTLSQIALVTKRRSQI